MYLTMTNPRKLDSTIVALLESALSEEYNAHYFYRNATNYCKNAGYTGGEKFFSEEAESELTHAKALQNYLTDWNIMPKMAKVDAPESISGLVDAISKAYDLELFLYDKYNEISKKVLAINAEAFDFLGKFRDIQKQSVTEYADLINQLRLIDSADKFQLFYFDQEVLKEK